jgi:hypothetical protein
MEIMSFNPQPKQKPFRSKKAREWFRYKKCIICGDCNTCGHHEPLNGHGIGTKGPDNQQVPLCFNHHRERHDIGRETFWNKYGLDWQKLVKRYERGINEAINKD